MTSTGSPEAKSFITNRYNGENTAVPVDPPLSSYQLKRKKERSARFRRIGLFVLVIAIVVGIIVGICISKGTFSSKKLKRVVYQQESQSESNSNNKRIILPKSTYNYSDFDLDTYCNDASCDKAANEILSSLNTSVNPCDNFYNFACQGWHAQNPRPDYEDEWSVFSKLQTQSLYLVIDILNQPVESGDVPMLSTAQRYYQTCLLAQTNDFQDKSREKQDMQFILDRLESYGGWPILYKNNTWNDRKFDWVKTIVGLKKELGLTRLLEVISFQSPDGDLAENSVFIVPPSGGSKDLEEDDEELDKAVNTLLTYKDFIVNVTRALLEFKGEYNYDKNYLEIKAFEIILVQIEFIKLKKLSVSGSAGLSGRIEITVEKLQRLLDVYTLFNPYRIDIWQLLNKFYANTGVSIAKTQLVDVFNLKYLVSLSSRVARMKPEALANYLHFEMALGMIGLSSIKKFQEYSSTLRKAMDGTTRDVPRERVCAAKVQIKFPFVLGHAYLKRKGVHKSGEQTSGYLGNDMRVTAGNFSKVHKVFDNIHSEFLHLTLSTPITYINKTFLSVELFLTDFCPGYPSWVLDKTRVQSEYTEISLSENYQNSKSYLEQSIQINRWAANKQLSELSVPFEVGECKWSHFPGTVGAFSRMFTVYVPYGMLQLPFYDSYLPASLNYGRLGAIIGHEIAHGLVGRGWSEFANGTETPLAQCLIDQYNRYKFDDTKDTNLTVDGELTLGENLADNAGLLAAYNAYKTSYYLDYSTRELNGLEKYSDDQLFFIGFAQNWCETATEKGLRKSLETDVHSPGQFRVLGALQNSAEFAQTWKCPVGSKMNPRRFYGRNKCTISFAKVELPLLQDLPSLIKLDPPTNLPSFPAHPTRLGMKRVRALGNNCTEVDAECVSIIDFSPLSRPIITARRRLPRRQQDENTTVSTTLPTTGVIPHQASFPPLALFSELFPATELPPEVPSTSTAPSSEDMSIAPEMLKVLECPVCQDLPKDKIISCFNGHSMCFQCAAKLRNCPICRVSLKQKIRNLTMEAMLETVRGKQSLNPKPVSVSKRPTSWKKKFLRFLHLE